MIITYYGAQFFKIQQGDLTIAYNPIREAPTREARVARFGADIAFVSTNHPHFNGVDNLILGDPPRVGSGKAGKKPFAIIGPGEYETKGVYAEGFQTFTHYGDGKERLNTIFYVLLDGIHLCFLGALDTPKIGEKIYDAITEVDILFVPVGGDGVITPAEAHKLSLTFSPRLIVPMQYNKDSLGKFLKETGAKDATPTDKLTIKKKDLEGKQGEVCVLSVS